MVRGACVVVAVAGVLVLAFGPDSRLGLLAIPLGATLLVASGAAWTILERRRVTPPGGPAHRRRPPTR